AWRCAIRSASSTLMLAGMSFSEFCRKSAVTMISSTAADCAWACAKARARVVSRRVDSGRFIPYSEQRGHNQPDGERAHDGCRDDAAAYSYASISWFRFKGVISGPALTGPPLRSARTVALPSGRLKAWDDVRVTRRCETARFAGAVRESLSARDRAGQASRAVRDSA